MPELIEIGPFAQSARGWGLSHHELLSWLRGVRQPLRPVSARAGRKEFIETTTCQRLPGGRSPSRGHGGALLRHGQYTGMVRSRLWPTELDGGGPTVRHPNLARRRHFGRLAGRSL